MATTPQKRGSAKEVAIDVLREVGEPLLAKEIAKRVLASGRCAGLKGKTPEATISAMLAVGSKPGGPFARVDKGTYALAGATAVTPAERTTSTTAKRSTSRKSATTPKPKTAAKRASTKRTSAKRSR